MWIFTNKAFLSVVAHRQREDSLLVRARLPGHIEQIFPLAKVEETPGADYRFRAVVSRKLVADALRDLALAGIDYDNFKNSIDDDCYHDACLEVWGIMHREQSEQVERERSDATPGRKRQRPSFLRRQIGE